MFVERLLGTACSVPGGGIRGCDENITSAVSEGSLADARVVQCCILKFALFAEPG